MKTLLITYNLNNNDGDYDALFKAIRTLGETWHEASKLDSVWFVKSNRSANEASEILKPAFDRDDNWFIVEIDGAPRQGWMPKALWDWLKS